MASMVTSPFSFGIVVRAFANQALVVCLPYYHAVADPVAAVAKVAEKIFNNILALGYASEVVRTVLKLAEKGGCSIARFKPLTGALGIISAFSGFKFIIGDIYALLSRSWIKEESPEISDDENTWGLRNLFNEKGAENARHAHRLEFCSTVSWALADIICAGSYLADMGVKFSKEWFDSPLTLFGKNLGLSPNGYSTIFASFASGFGTLDALCSIRREGFGLKNCLAIGANVCRLAGYILLPMKFDILGTVAQMVGNSCSFGNCLYDEINK